VAIALSLDPDHLTSTADDKRSLTCELLEGGVIGIGGPDKQRKIGDSRVPWLRRRNLKTVIPSTQVAGD
jgi:hypothetical protein